MTDPLVVERCLFNSIVHLVSDDRMTVNGDMVRFV